LFPALENFDLVDVKRDRLRKCLDAKARAGLSKAVCCASSMGPQRKRAADDAIIEGNPAGSLVVPREARTTERKRNITEDEIALALSVFDLRERIVFRLAVLVGMRPGEIVASDGAG
jgi:hypothetical protein